MWYRLGRHQTPFLPVPHSPTSLETIPWCTDVLLPIRRYEGDVDISIVPCIGQRLGDDDYDATKSRFKVIGLTKDVIIVMEKKYVDIIVQLLDINTSPLQHVTSELDILHVKLELICDTLNRYAVLQFGITLTTRVVPQPFRG
jgi:hypothetical protein